MVVSQKRLEGGWVRQWRGLADSLGNDSYHPNFVEGFGKSMKAVSRATAARCRVDSPDGHMSWKKIQSKVFLCGCQNVLVVPKGWGCQAGLTSKRRGSESSDPCQKTGRKHWWCWTWVMVPGWERVSRWNYPFCPYQGEWVGSLCVMLWVWKKASTFGSFW